jgi:Mce-associated membrane protein
VTSAPVFPPAHIELTADPGPRVPFAGASRRLVVTLVAVVAVLVAAVGALGVLRWQAASTEQAATDALGSARSGAEILFSYDYRTIDNDIAAAKKVVTGALAADYAATSATIKPLAAKNLAIVKAAISEAGVVSASSDKVVVFLYLNQTTQSKNVAATELDMSRVRVTMVPVGDDWRIARAEPL